MTAIRRQQSGVVLAKIHPIQHRAPARMPTPLGGMDSRLAVDRTKASVFLPQTGFRRLGSLPSRPQRASR